jgi:hypothetical protein
MCRATFTITTCAARPTVLWLSSLGAKPARPTYLACGAAC